MYKRMFLLFLLSLPLSFPRTTLPVKHLFLHGFLLPLCIPNWGCFVFPLGSTNARGWRCEDGEEERFLVSPLVGSLTLLFFPVVSGSFRFFRSLLQLISSIFLGPHIDKKHIPFPLHTPPFTPFFWRPKRTRLSSCLEYKNEFRIHHRPKNPPFETTNGDTFQFMS